MAKRPKKPGRGILPNGRSKSTAQFMQIHHYIWDDRGFQALPHSAVRVFVELIRRYNGGNNGRIKMPMREAEARLNMSYSTVSRAIDALTKAGFVVVTTQGTADPGRMGGNLASEYRLTYAASWDGKPATRDWGKSYPKENPSCTHATAPLHERGAVA